MPHYHRRSPSLAAAAVAAAVCACALVPRPAAAFGLSFDRIFNRPQPPAASGFGAVSKAVFGLDEPSPFPRRRVAIESAAFGRFFADVPSVASTAEPVPGGVRGLLPASAASPARPRLPAFAFWESAPLPASAALAPEPPIGRAPAGVETPALARASASFAPSISGPFATSSPRFFSVATPRAAPPSALSVPVRLGGVKLTSSVVAQRLADTQLAGEAAFDAGAAPAAAPQWDKLRGGVSFPVPVLGKHVSVNLDGDLEHVYRRDGGAAYVAPDAGGQPASQSLPDPGSPAMRYFPNYVDVVHSTLTAGASLPLSRDVVVSARYDTQGYRGSYGPAAGQSIAERKDQYQGTVTYTIPKTGSSVSVLFRNQQYRDPVLPASNVNANREDLKFTVRF